MNSKNNSPSFSIVTNSIRRDLLLVEKSLHSSLAQSTSPEGIKIADVIFIDQNNTPLALSEDIANHPHFKKIHAPVGAVSTARNLAVFSPETNWIIFCDDDGYLEAGYVQKLLKVLGEHPREKIFAGSIKRTDNQDFYSQRHALGGDLNQFIFTKLLMGSNFIIEKNTFERLKRFDERFGAGAYWGSGEETDLAWKAFFSGTPMRYTPELVVFHIPPRSGTWSDEFKKSFRYGQGKGALVAKWLIEEHRLTVMIELLEMIFYPMIKFIPDLLLFRFKQASCQIAALTGRIYGFLKFSLRKLVT